MASKDTRDIGLEEALSIYDAIAEAHAAVAAMRVARDYMQMVLTMHKVHMSDAKTTQKDLRMVYDAQWKLQDTLSAIRKGMDDEQENS